MRKGMQGALDDIEVLNMVVYTHWEIRSVTGGSRLRGSSPEYLYPVATMLSKLVLLQTHNLLWQCHRQMVTMSEEWFGKWTTSCKHILPGL